MSLGALLFCVATATFLFALSSGGHRYAWASWPMFALLAGALIGFAFLLRWERRHHDPVIPIHFLKVPAIARSDAVVMCFGGALFSAILYMPLYLQLGRGMGIGASGALLLPITLAQVTSAAIVGSARHAHGPREHLPEDRPDARDRGLPRAGRVGGERLRRR